MSKYCRPRWLDPSRSEVLSYSLSCYSTPHWSSGVIVSVRVNSMSIVNVFKSLIIFKSLVSLLIALTT